MVFFFFRMVSNIMYFCICGCRDLQSYLSGLSLFLASESKKLYILVDNRPWLRDLGSRRAQLWQLMVTKVVKSTFLHLNCCMYLILRMKLIYLFFKFSRDYLRLQTLKHRRRERKERSLVADPTIVNQRSSRNGSHWLMRQHCLVRGFCYL